MVGRRPGVEVLELLEQLREALEAQPPVEPICLAAEQVASFLEGNSLVMLL